MSRDDFLRPAAKDRLRAREGQTTPPPRERSRSPVSPVSGEVQRDEHEDENIVVDEEIDVGGADENQLPVAPRPSNGQQEDDALDVVGGGARRPSPHDGVVAMVPGSPERAGGNGVALAPGPLSSPRAGFRNINREVAVPEPERMQVAVRPSPRPKPKSTPQDRGERVSILSNFVKLVPANNTHMHNYHVTFEPNVESAPMRRRLFHIAFRSEFNEQHVTYDGMFDARSTYMTPDEVTVRSVSPREKQVECEDPTKVNPHLRTYIDTNDPDDRRYVVTLRRTGIMPWENFEMLRIYNLNFKAFMRFCGLFAVTTSGAYLHPDWCKPVGKELASLQGFKTSTGVHEDNQVFVQMEFISKLLQQKNVLQTMNDLRNMGPNPRETIISQLTDRMIVTNYNKVVYKIVEFNFNLSPQSEFFHKKLNRQMSYIEYYKVKYNVFIQSVNQPLILVEPYRRNKKLVKHEEKIKPTEASDIYVVPELCNLAGMTETQRADTRLKTDLIRASQIAPNDRIKQMRSFFQKLFNEKKVAEVLKKMKYDIERKPVHIQARVMPQEIIGIGPRAVQDAQYWPKVDFATAGFEQHLLKEKLVHPPRFENLYILITKPDSDNEKNILNRLRGGFEKIGFSPKNVKVLRMSEGDQGHHFSARLRQIRKEDEGDAVLIILPRQNKDKYDAIKKIASTERGHITQVVTSKLIMDDRKASGAAVKIAIQMAAKMGGEPWFINIPLTDTMICGYDTYTDTANKNKTYGAFVASMNQKYSKWWSKACEHTNDAQMSQNLRDNLRTAIEKFHKNNNNKYPKKIFIYRDGVGDGQLKHVDQEELKHVQKVCGEIDVDIKIAFIIVNKKVGARFYLKRGENYVNPIPGTCIDSVVTKADRFDFYLISQSTRQGTIAPTYYNVIFDNTYVTPGNHQLMAFKLCFLYYNWTGTVRVPATCQYAHKLAQLCGETLHNVPNDKLDDYLHYL